ncbi:MAG: UDP-N-acetylglucosamine 4,6-dehydratase [Epsilonproteobacteria bacterium]|nr:UDP-N-acetylglucosamine 4,6-dehydratase [Campylobacterota bacterium]NPA64439.1 polysaccharide biosynthesis protein [Campylobacterota bacterium]
MRATKRSRALFFFLGDFFLSLLSLFLAYELRFNFSVPQEYWSGFFKIFAFLFSFKALALYFFKQYHFTWRYYSLHEFKKLFLAHLVAYGAMALLLALFYPYFLPFPRSALVIDLFLSLLLLSGFRIAKRLYLESLQRPLFKTAAIYGITPQTKHLIDSFQSGALEYKPQVVIEKDPTSDYIGGVKVMSEEEFLQSSLQPHAFIIAKELEAKELDNVIERFKHKTQEFRIATLTKEEPKPVEIEDLLARKPKDLDLEAIERFIKNKKVLITGAGGSIGSELVRQCEAFGAQKIVAVEMSEYNLYQLSENHPNIVPILCDVSQKEEIDEIVSLHKPDLIIHAAAYKHVPLCELNPKAAIKNNILGTINTIDAAIDHHIPHFILISTDKAVNPTNIMGATKRVCELYAQNIDTKKTILSAVRFGNVLGSSGSVIPKFRSQILSGGPVTVTHPQITRYFMLISEACQLVLQSATIAKGKEIFILDMGEPVKILDLAKKMMRLYNKEVPIEFIGLRPGEKLYEELLLEGAEEKTRYNSIFIAKPTTLDRQDLHRWIQELLKAKSKERILTILRHLVPEFRHKPHG